MRKEIKRKNFEWNCWSIRFQKQIKRKKSPEKVITTDQLIAELKQKVQEDKEKEERKLKRKGKAKNKKEKKLKANNKEKNNSRLFLTEETIWDVYFKYILSMFHS